MEEVTKGKCDGSFAAAVKSCKRGSGMPIDCSAELQSNRATFDGDIGHVAFDEKTTRAPVGKGVQSKLFCL